MYINICKLSIITLKPVGHHVITILYIIPRTYTYN